MTAIDILRDMLVAAAACAAVPAAKAARKTTVRMRASVLIEQTVVLPLHRVQIRMVAGDESGREPRITTLVPCPPRAFTHPWAAHRAVSREWQQACAALAWQITSLESKLPAMRLSKNPLNDLIGTSVETAAMAEQNTFWLP